MTATASTEEEDCPVESESATLNRELNASGDSDAILGIVEANANTMNAVNVATALHRLASINKKRRAEREALFRDPRFARLLDAVDQHSAELNPRSVADVLWSLATLHHWPARLLKPVVEAVVRTLARQTFKAQHLSTIVWALASLESRPMRLSSLGDVVADNASVPKSVSDILLKRIEAQAIPLTGQMNPQNCVNLLWGCAKLGYQPTALLPAIATRLIEPGMISKAIPVEVADLAFALAELENICPDPGDGEKAGGPEAEETCAVPEVQKTREIYNDLLLGLADRAAPEAILSSFSSRQLVVLMSSMIQLDAIPLLPDGRVDAWIGAVRAAHVAKPMLSKDARNLETALRELGKDASWVKRTEMLNRWLAIAEGRSTASSAYTDAELLITFRAIDTDNSGDIDQAELLDALKQINPDADAKTVEGMLSFADEDGDRSVSFEEFKQIMVKQKKPPKKFVGA